MEKDASTPHVGHLVNQLSHSTAATDLTASLSEYTQVESTVISLQKPEHYPKGVRVRWPSDDGISDESSLQVLKWLKNTVGDCDLLIAHHTLSGILGSAVGKISGLPIISREGNDHKRFSTKVRAARTITNLMSKEVICVSQSVADSYAGFERIIPNRKFRVINNGVDTDEIELAKNIQWDLFEEVDIDPDKWVVGTAGMLTEQKNQILLLDAMEDLVSRKEDDIHLAIAGDGPLRHELKEHAYNLDINEYVHFLGYLERGRVYKMLHQLDCYTMPSRWEGFSAAALQAMAVGVPCVFSHIPSFNSQYPNDLVHFHDPHCPNELARAIEASLDENGELKNQRQEFVKDNFTLEIMAKKYSDAIYSHL